MAPPVEHPFKTTSIGSDQHLEPSRAPFTHRIPNNAGSHYCAGLEKGRDASGGSMIRSSHFQRRLTGGAASIDGDTSCDEYFANIYIVAVRGLMKFSGVGTVLQHVRHHARAMLVISTCVGQRRQIVRIERVRISARIEQYCDERGPSKTGRIMQQRPPWVLLPFKILVDRDDIWPCFYHETQRLDSPWPMSQDFHSLPTLVFVDRGQRQSRQRPGVGVGKRAVVK